MGFVCVGVVREWPMRPEHGAICGVRGEDAWKGLQGWIAGIIGIE